MLKTYPLHALLHRSLLLIAAFALCGATALSASVASTSGNVIYVDSSSNVSPNLLGNYVSFLVTNDTVSTISDAWVTAGSFTGSYVTLGVNETGKVHLGPMASGASKTVYFYLNVDCSSFSAGQCNVATPQALSINLYSGPSSANLISTQPFSVTVQETTSAQANKVTTVTTSSTDPILGSLITVTVTGSTGTIGSAKVFYASPQTTYDFPANVFTLYSTTVTFSGGNTGTYSGQLLIPSSAFSSASNTNYTFVSTYLVGGMNSASTAVSPVAFISSGTQMKHTDTNGYASLPPIPPTSNTVTIQKLASALILPNGGAETYTLRASNSGSVAVTLDSFVDTLPTGVSYVPGTSTFGGVSIGDPATSGGVLTWSNISIIPANGSADLTFQAVVPNVPGVYLNSAVAYIGATQLDSTLSTSDTSPASVSIGVGTPVLSIGSTHTGNFTQGQTGATYTLTAGDTGSGPTSGPVTVIDTLPAGLTGTSISGAGWTCTLATLTCTRSDVLAAGSSYPAITLTVNVTSNAAATLTNSVTASGGGASSAATATDSTTITQQPVLSIGSTHTGNFTQGQTGATYTLTAGDTGSGPTSGPVTVIDTVPAGLTATSISGTGWTCTLATLTCTRSDVLAAGSSYPAITLTVNVASNAAATLTNSVTASGGGASSSATATDSTTITQQPVLSIGSTHTGNFTQGQTGATYTLTAGDTGSGPTSGPVTVIDTLPAGLTATSINGTGWTCTLATLTCTRSDVLAAGSSYPAITLTVNVASNAAATLTNSVTASGGGASNAATATDSTTITPKLASATTTTLAITPGTPVNDGVTVTLSATVTEGLIPVGQGVVDFCDATAPSCSGAAVIASGQLNASGIVIARFVPGVGGYSLIADFVGTSEALPSESAPQSLLVNGTGGYGTTTGIAADGGNGVYTLTGTVQAFGKPVPTGTVSFIDTSNGSSTVASAQLDSTTLGYTVSSAPNPPSVSGLPVWLATADFNNDGNPDIAVPNGAKNSVAVFLGNGDGTFQAATSFATEPNTSAYSIAVGDFNADGNPDLVIVNKQGSSTVSILLGNGDGTFQSQTSYAVGSNPSAVAVADVNGDGDADLVVVNQDDNTVGILLGNGDGTFQPQTAYPVGNTPQSVEEADLNGDGVVDLVVANSVDNTVSVLLGKGDGTLQAQVSYPTANSPVAIALADVNGDNHVDIVVAHRDTNSVGILLGNGDGTFQPEVTFPANNSPVAVAIADFNGDGRLDIAVSNNTDGTTSVLLGNGDGTFQAATAFNAGAQPYGLVAADFNGDGLPDIAAVSNTASGSLSVSLSEHTESAKASSVSLAPGAHEVLASYPGDANHRASQSNPVQLTGVAPVATTTTISASLNSVASGQSVTFTAIVSPTPTGMSLGTVSFFDGSTSLGTTGIDASGNATLVTSTLSVGAHSVTAVYSGNTGFKPSTSGPVSVTVQNPSWYTVTAPQTPFTVKAGASVNINVSLPPIGGAYNNTVVLSAIGLPPLAGVSFNPPTVVPGSGGATTVMTVHTSAQRTSIDRTMHFPFSSGTIALGLCLVVIRRKHLKRSGFALLLLILLGASSLLSTTGCGGGFQGRLPQSQTYVITITGTSGSLHPSTTVTLIVQ